MRQALYQGRPEPRAQTRTNLGCANGDPPRPYPNLGGRSCRVLVAELLLGMRGSDDSRPEVKQSPSRWLGLPPLGKRGRVQKLGADRARSAAWSPCQASLTACPFFPTVLPQKRARTAHSRAPPRPRPAPRPCGSVGGSTSPDTGGPSIRSREGGRGVSRRAESSKESRWPPVRGLPRPTAYRARSSTRRETAPRPAAPPGPRARR